MNKTNLIINYLPQTLTDEEFRSMFLSIGQIKSTKIVRDRATGYSYGFGFVDFVREQDAQRAIQTLNGLQLQNKRIKVAYSRNGETVKGANLYICNLPQALTQEELEEHFGQYGNIIQSRILYDQASGKSKGVGFVLFSSRPEAESAMNNLDGTVFPGGTEPITVKFAEDNKGKARPPIVVVRQGGPGGYNNGGSYGAGGGAQSEYSGGNQGGYGGGGGGGGNYGPMRNQSRGYRFNPMANNNQSFSQGGGGGSGGSGSMGSHNEEEGGFVLFVYNIGPQADERELWQLFSPFGSIQKVNVIKDHNKDQGKGYGFVTMANYHDAMSAIQSLNGYRYSTKPLQVSFKSQKE